MVERFAGMQPRAKSDSGGCYIATAVYGSYDAPAVMTLRGFRDRRLVNSVAGRGFIRFYYAVSPTLVSRFGHFRALRRMVKFGLDRFVTHLQRVGY